MAGVKGLRHVRLVRKQLQGTLKGSALRISSLQAMLGGLGASVHLKSTCCCFPRNRHCSHCFWLGWPPFPTLFMGGLWPGTLYWDLPVRAGVSLHWPLFISIQYS